MRLQRKLTDIFRIVHCEQLLLPRRIHRVLPRALPQAAPQAAPQTQHRVQPRSRQWTSRRCWHAPPALSIPLGSSRSGHSPLCDCKAAVKCDGICDAGVAPRPTPYRVQVIQYDDRTVCLKLRTPTAFNHLHLCWHQTAARLCLGQPPDRGATAEAFAFGEARLVFGHVSHQIVFSHSPQSNSVLWCI